MIRFNLVAAVAVTLLWAAGAQACFVVANGTITFNSTVSPPSCGGIANAFPTQSAAQAFLNSLMQGGGSSTATSAAATGGAATAATAATGGAPMPSTAMQVFSLTTPDRAAAVNHERLLFDIMTDHPRSRPFIDLGVAAALLSDQGLLATDLYFYNLGVLTDALRASWELTPEGKAAKARSEAARRAWKEAHDLRRGTPEERAAYAAMLEAERAELAAFQATPGFQGLKQQSDEQRKAGEDKGLFRVLAGSESVPSSPQIEPTTEMQSRPPPDGPPESILDSIGDFVPIS